MLTVGREKGSGTIVPTKTPKGADRWRVAVTMADGRRVWRTARTPREAERIRQQLVEARELDLDPTRQTLGAYLRSWIAGLRDARHQRVRPRTIEQYEGVVEHHVIPALGGLKLAAVTPRRIQAWVDADPAAPAGVRLHHAVLRRALNVAAKQRLLPYNPASFVELPAVHSDVARPLTLDEVRALLAATRADRLHALWRLAVVTGLRQGELLGLAWEDIDLGNSQPLLGGRAREGNRAAVDDGLAPLRRNPHDQRQGADQARSAGDHIHATVTVTAQLQRIGGAWVRTPPKAARTLTRVALDPGTVAVLDEHRRRMAAERTPAWRYHGLVFVTTRGEPFHNTEVRRRFGEACDAVGIPRRRFHDLRGTTATMLRALGVSEEARMARLGHNSQDMAQHYAKASEEQDRLAVGLLGEAIAGRGVG